MKDRSLEVYLSDHYGGSTYALELIRSSLEHYPDPPLGPFFRSLEEHVHEDQQVLRGFLLRIGGSESRTKDAAAWVAEKLSRVKLHEPEDRPGAALLERLETLALGVRGKRSLWQSLGAASGGTGRFAGVELASLERRAEAQLDEIERHRLAAARQAFVVGDHVRVRARLEHAEDRGHEDGDRSIGGVLLDVDGTLVDSNDAHARAWQEALSESGRTVSFERVRPLVGLGGDEIVAWLAGVDPEDDEGRAIVRAHVRRFLDVHLGSCRPFEGARALLERMREAGLRLTVATSAPEEVMVPVLETAGLADLVDAATSAADVRHAKPAPDVLEAALDLSGCAREEVLLLGDTPYDVAAGARAGVEVVAVRCGGSGDAELAGALAVFQDPAELLERFEASPFLRRALRPTS